MSQGYNILIMASYPSTEAAQKNFDQLTQLVKNKQIESEGTILVKHDVGVIVRITRDRRGAAAGWTAIANYKTTPLSAILKTEFS